MNKYDCKGKQLKPRRPQTYFEFYDPLEKTKDLIDRVKKQYNSVLKQYFYIHLLKRPPQDNQHDPDFLRLKSFYLIDPPQNPQKLSQYFTNLRQLHQQLVEYKSSRSYEICLEILQSMKQNISTVKHLFGISRIEDQELYQKLKNATDAQFQQNMDEFLQFEQKIHNDWQETDEDGIAIQKQTNADSNDHMKSATNFQQEFNHSNRVKNSQFSSNNNQQVSLKNQRLPISYQEKEQRIEKEQTDKYIYDLVIPEWNDFYINYKSNLSFLRRYQNILQNLQETKDDNQEINQMNQNAENCQAEKAIQNGLSERKDEDKVSNNEQNKGKIEFYDHQQIEIEDNKKFESEELKMLFEEVKTEANIMISQKDNKFDNEGTRESELMPMNSSSLQQEWMILSQEKLNESDQSFEDVQDVQNDEIEKSESSKDPEPKK